MSPTLLQWITFIWTIKKKGVKVLQKALLTFFLCNVMFVITCLCEVIRMWFGVCFVYISVCFLFVCVCVCVFVFLCSVCLCVCIVVCLSVLCLFDRDRQKPERGIENFDRISGQGIPTYIQGCSLSQKLKKICTYYICRIFKKKWRKKM